MQRELSQQRCLVERASGDGEIRKRHIVGGTNGGEAARSRRLYASASHDEREWAWVQQ